MVLLAEYIYICTRSFLSSEHVEFPCSQKKGTARATDSRGRTEKGEPSELTSLAHWWVVNHSDLNGTEQTTTFQTMTSILCVLYSPLAAFHSTMDRDKSLKYAYWSCGEAYGLLEPVGDVNDMFRQRTHTHTHSLHPSPLTSKESLGHDSTEHDVGCQPEG